MQKRYTFSLNLMKKVQKKNMYFNYRMLLFEKRKEEMTLFVFGLFPITGEFTTVVMVEITT